MIRNLDECDTPLTRRVADVVVVGAGIAGLVAACRLAERGQRVVLLESGGQHQFGDTHPLNEVVQRGSPYEGAASGRFRCLGGTSTRWGGAMCPFMARDLVDGQWPVPYSELAAYVPEVEQLFALPPSCYEDHELTRRDDGAPAAYLARYASWPPFGRRNVATLFSRELGAEHGPEVWLQASATQLLIGPDGRLERIIGESPGGRSLEVCAGEVVIAAGAIESTRLLLLADRQCDDRVFAPHDVLGRYFHDHLSVVVGDVAAADRNGLNRVTGFQFVRGGMRNLRFEPSDRPEIRASIPPGFAHLAFQTQAGSGFDALRSMFRSLQQRRLPEARIVGQLFSSLPWLARAVWWRYAEGRLLYPEDARIELHMVIAQQPKPDSRIQLDQNRADMFGQPLAAIDWRISAEDVSAVSRSAELFRSAWEACPMARLGQLRLREAIQFQTELLHSGGIYHPAGSTRMGRGPGDGVVDSDFRTFGIPNMTVLSTSSFPTIGGANPTMMLIMAAMRAADRLAAAARR